MDALRQWIMGLVGAALVSAAASAVTPEGAVRKVTLFACGLVTVLALAAPLAGVGAGLFAESRADIGARADDITAGADDTYNSLTRSIIEEKCEAYILDKGSLLGIGHISAEVSVRWSTDGCWYPVGAEIVSDADSGQMSDLSWYIEAELGIAAEDQHWSTSDG